MSINNHKRQVIIALGGNLPKNEASSVDLMRRALQKLDEVATICVSRVSRAFRTPAYPAGSGPDFVNAAAVIETALPPDDVLRHLHAIEAELGRVRTTRWGARTLDLDLIARGAEMLPNIDVFTDWFSLPLSAQRTQSPSDLILPHPRMHERAFVLIPMLDIAPDWRHPHTGKTVQEMAADLPEADRRAVRPLAEGLWPPQA